MLNIEDRVIFTGRIGNVSDWYDRADIFALTSDHEGFPNVLVEAMAHQCAVVSVDCDTGPREVIKNGVNGVLVEHKNPPALVAGLKSLMEDEKRRKHLALAAVRVREEFGERRIMSLWDRFIMKN